MPDKRRGLGRGLQELLSTADWLKRDDIQLFYWPVDMLEPNPHQPRQVGGDDGMEEMACSIREKGVLQPILVTRTDDPDIYRILAGERRWRAAKLAGLPDVPVLLRDSTSEEALEIALIENIQRRDLNCIEEALAYKRLQDEFHLTQEKIAKRVGKDRSTIANLLRLLQLPEEIQGAVLNGQIAMGHARAILGLETEQDQMVLFRRILSRHLSVRQTEQAVAAELRKTLPGHGPAHDEEQRKIRDIQERLQSLLGVRVSLNRRGRRGRITISFRSEMELERVLAALGLE
ncbi:MAG: ParB/RepB/Spo0J family partition protein [Deltaproteobacteria bacterium]|nr:ParB/RepB/Spo0J family partition protein [Deltaproteobacteria bacterium]